MYHNLSTTIDKEIGTVKLSTFEYFLYGILSSYLVTVRFELTRGEDVAVATEGEWVDSRSVTEQLGQQVSVSQVPQQQAAVCSTRD